jgi:hypothetical protein
MSGESIYEVYKFAFTNFIYTSDDDEMTFMYLRVYIR